MVRRQHVDGIQNPGNYVPPVGLEPTLCRF